MELDVLLWALGFMLATFVIGGAFYAIYERVANRRRRR